MKKQLAIVGIVVLLFSVIGLSGCNQIQNSDTTNGSPDINQEHYFSLSGIITNNNLLDARIELMVSGENSENNAEWLYSTVDEGANSYYANAFETVNYSCNIKAGYQRYLLFMGWDYDEGNNNFVLGSTTTIIFTNPSENDVFYYGEIKRNKTIEISTTFSLPNPYEPLVVSAEASVLRGIPPLTVSFTGTIKDNTRNITSYCWDFGDGEKATQQNPSHTFQNSGTYTVIFNATDDMDVTGFDELIIQVDAIGIIDYSAFAESYDWVRIVGLVKNFGDDNIVKVKVTATLYDAQGSVIGFNSEYTHRAEEYSGILLPQETTGFILRFSNMPDYDHCIVEITSYSITSQQAYHDNLKILDAHIDPQSEGEFGYSYLSGIVRNLGSQDVSSVSVYANLFDSNNNIVAIEEAPLGTVYSGQSENFNIWIWASQDYDRYELEVTCWEYLL